MVARPLGEPCFDFGVLVGGIVVDDEMDIEIVGHVGIDMAQEGEKFLVPMALLALTDDLAASDVQGGEQCGGAMSDVIMGDTFDIAQPHGQYGLGTVQCLYLGFLIDAQDHGVVRWVEVEPDDVAHFFDEEGIVGDLEVALAMRLDTEEIEPTLDGAFGHARLLGHGAYAPMRGIGRFRLERPIDDLGHLLILIRSRTATSQLVMQALDAEFDVPFAPFADGILVQPHALGDGGVGFTIGTGQYDLGTLNQSMGKGPRVGEAQEVSTLFVTQHDRGAGASARHGQHPGWDLPIIVLFFYGTIH